MARLRDRWLQEDFGEAAPNEDPEKRNRRRFRENPEEYRAMLKKKFMLLGSTAGAVGALSAASAGKTPGEKLLFGTVGGIFGAAGGAAGGALGAASRYEREIGNVLG